MKVLLFGATGMVGQGVLRECLLDPAVTQVTAIGRSATGRQDSKLREIVQKDLLDYSAIENKLAGFDACFFCLGVSSAGMSAERYRHITYDITLAAGQMFARLNAGKTFVYVSGMGADSTERGRSGWARVKGATENALFQMPLSAVIFRPGGIVPMHGIRSKTAWYRAFYAILGPALKMLAKVAPRYVTTTENVGRAMIRAAKEGAPKQLMENGDIDTFGR